MLYTILTSLQWTRSYRIVYGVFFDTFSLFSNILNLGIKLILVQHNKGVGGVTQSGVIKDAEEEARRRSSKRRRRRGNVRKKQRSSGRK